MNLSQEQFIRNKYNLYLFNHRLKNNRGAYGNDSERKKTYRAEWKFQFACKNSIVLFKTIGEAQSFASRVCKSQTWSKICQEAPAEVSMSYGDHPPLNKKIVVSAKMRNTGKGFAGYAEGNQVTLDSNSGFDAYTLLHEMAHCAGHFHHGRSFRKTVLKLVSRFIGRYEAEVLKRCFKELKLSVGDARKPLSFEKWEEAFLRMENARKERTCYSYLNLE